jgi:hypothetical protein
MKRNLSAGVLALGLALMLTGDASAQSIAMKVQIPFDFSVRDNTLEAGEYVVRLINNSVLSLKGANGGVAVAMTYPIRARQNIDTARLVFSSYGGVYFLSAAFWPGYGEGQEILKSKGELELLARNGKAKTVNLKTGDLVRR